ARLGKLGRQILLAGLDLSLELVAEGREAVGPRLDRVLPRAALRHLERAREQVVVDELERRRAPAALARPAVEDVGGEQVVAVAEHLRRDLDLLPDGVLGRMAPAVDLRPDALDANTRLRLGQLRAHNHADDVAPLERRAAPPDLSARGTAGRGGVPVRRLARRGRPIVVAGAAARAARRAPLAVPVGVGLRVLGGTPRRP